jgi:hypothetical protein
MPSASSVYWSSEYVPRLKPVQQLVVVEDEVLG